MSLDSSALESDIEALATSPGATIAACAHQWAEAVKNYASGVVPPSASVNAAAATLETALAAAFATVAAPLMEVAFTAFGATLGTGMAPAFVAVPPAGPVGFAALFATLPPTHAAAAAGVAGAIDTWMKTGTATPSGGGPAVPWS